MAKGWICSDWDSITITIDCDIVVMEEVEWRRRKIRYKVEEGNVQSVVRAISRREKVVAWSIAVSKIDDGCCVFYNHRLELEGDGSKCIVCDIFGDELCDAAI